VSVSAPTVFELFTGAGGMALGLDQAGFRHVGLVERDPSAIETLRANAGGAGVRVGGLVEAQDVHAVRYREVSDLTLLAAGVPCQPFSLAGNHLGKHDYRNLFPEVFRAQRETTPRALLLENVWGLARTNFRLYLEYLLLHLALPALTARRHEGWIAHKARLRSSLKLRSEPTYDVWVSAIECANFGVPQRRNRLFIVALRTDLDTSWQWPSATHSEDGLLHAKYCSGTYWADHGLEPRGNPEREPQATLLSLRPSRRWRTVRDAISKLPTPALDGDGRHHPNHHWIDGARAYRGHTGSRLDEPSKTLKAGVHGVPGGENMLMLEDGSLRYFTVHEAALLQTFPAGYVFCGTRSAAIRQIGNAAPARVVKILGAKVLQLTSARVAASGGFRAPHVDLLDGARLLQL
jgi:DNA (cytosine-5)-methyltransferase 1